MSISPSVDFARPFSQARWFDVLPRRLACPQLSARVLLHAGPPFRGTLPAPVINSAIQALLFEGLASDPAEARDLVLRGAVELRPAQNYRVATPLAQVVSASMLLVAVKQHDEICHAPIIEGSAPALRFGSAAPECLRRMRDAGAWIESSVAPLVRRAPLAIDELIRIAVAGGDECHARTTIANEALAARLRGLDAGGVDRLRAMPAFVLAPLMAAAAAAMRSSRCDIEAIGANGVEFGVRRRGDQAWRQLPAEAPRGLRFDGMEALTPLAAIGDSAVIDFCGLGGQALAAAPLLAAEWSAALPADALTRRQSLIDPNTGIVAAQRVLGTALAPLINLAIIDRDGVMGLMGRGFYSPPLELFSPAAGLTRAR